MIKESTIISYLSEMKTGESVKLYKVDNGCYEPIEFEPLERKIQNVFGKAGDLLYCDQLIINDLQEGELTIDGECSMLFKREKHIDEQKRIQEQMRLFDILRMGFYGVFQWVEFTEFLPMKYNDEYDIVRIPFELGKISNKE